MTEDDLRDIADDHMAVTTYDTRGRVYQGCPTCPMIPGRGLLMHPCPTIQLVDETRKLLGWVEFMEHRLGLIDPDWNLEMLP